MKSKLLIPLIFVGCTPGLETSSTAQAITLDPATGIGFVGKGAVQSRFGWNNAELQANAGGLSFWYEADAVYQQSCLHTTGSEQKVVEVTFKKHVDLSSGVDFEARRNPQTKINGFNLLGISGTTGGGAPTDLCNPGQSEPDDLWVPDPAGTYPTVTLTSGSPPALYVEFAGERHLLPLDGDSDDGDDGDDGDDDGV